MFARVVVPLISLGIFECSGDGVDWARFNSLDDEVEIQVTAGSDLGDPVTIELFSTTGSIIVGTATVDPGSGPVGTLHTLTVNVYDDYEDVVERVQIIASTNDRGEDEFELQRDSADHGVWQVQLESSGVTGEERTDVFTVRLYEVDDGSVTFDTDT